MKANFIKPIMLTALLAALMLTIPMPAQAESDTAKDAAKVVSQKVQMLFVQNAQHVELDKGKLVLKGLNPATVFFSDRPQRIAGHMTTGEFLPLWKDGKDSFTADPPNATLSIFAKGEVADVVMELRNPVLKGDELSYDVKVLKGESVARGGPCSLFIDIIGMPMTPYSFAGAARRTEFRRSMMYHPHVVVW